MPQLDSSTFPTQIVWLVICFIVLYLLMWKVALPRIAAVLEARRSRIDDDLDRAGALKEEAAQALAAYEASLAEAHAGAQAELRAAAEQLAAETSARQADLVARLKAETAAAEARIARAKQQALKNIAAVAAEVAQAATARLIGVNVGEPALRKAIDAAMGDEE